MKENSWVRVRKCEALDVVAEKRRKRTAQGLYPGPCRLRLYGTGTFRPNPGTCTYPDLVVCCSPHAYRYVCSIFFTVDAVVSRVKIS